MTYNTTEKAVRNDVAGRAGAPGPVASNQLANVL